MKSQPLPREPYSSTDICSSCEAPLTGRYCNQCGERRIERGEQTVRHFVRESLADLASLDGKLLRTLRALVFRPGHLTREYMDGRRVLYMRPLQIFLLANLIYFVAQPYTGYTSYNTPLASQMDQQLYSKALGLRAVVERDVANRDLPLDVYTARFDAKSAIYAKSLILLMVPLFALVVALLFFRKRRPALQHLVFATHFYAWDLLIVSSLFLILWSRWLLPPLAQLLTGMGVNREGPAGNTLWMLIREMPSTLLIVPYLAIAFRRVYLASWGGAVLCALLAVPLLVLVVISYRLLLFWLTFATLS